MVDYMYYVSIAVNILFYVIIFAIIPATLYLLLSFSYDVKILKEYDNGTKLTTARAKLVRIKGSNAKRAKFLFNKRIDVPADLFKYSMSKGGLSAMFPIFGFQCVFLKQDINGNFHAIRPSNEGDVFATVPHDNLLWLTNRNKEILLDNAEKKGFLMTALPYVGVLFVGGILIGGLLLIEENVKRSIELGENVLAQSSALARPTLEPVSGETDTQSKMQELQKQSEDNVASKMVSGILGD